MRDVFYTVVVIWIVWRIYHSFQSRKNFTRQQSQTRPREGEVTIETGQSPKSKSDDKGDYVDFEEIKD